MANPKYASESGLRLNDVFLSAVEQNKYKIAGITTHRTWGVLFSHIRGQSFPKKEWIL